MIIVLASRTDSIAATFVRYATATGAHAVLVAPDDLCKPGWRLRVGRPADGCAVVNGEPLPVSCLSGVLCRLAAVRPGELVQIVPADREYVAAELTAFLLAWLYLLPCRVVNAPSAPCLSGPGWRREQWLHAARRIGILALGTARRVVPGSSSADLWAPQGAAVTVVGSGCPTGPLQLRAPAQRLAAAAGVDLLTVWFAEAATGYAVAGANAWPDVSTSTVAIPLLELLRG